MVKTVITTAGNAISKDFVRDEIVPLINAAMDVQTPAPATPKEGGSYTLDDKTGEHTLIERTQENTQPRSKP